MSDPTRTREALRRAQIRCKSKGTPIAIRYQTWPGGKPVADPVTGAFLPSSSLNEAVEAIVLTRAFVHFAEAKSVVRQFAEIQAGDCLLDVVIPLMQVASPGDTSFTANQVVDVPTLGAANRALTSTQTQATANRVYLGDLANPEFVIYPSANDQQNDTHGQVYVQAQVGQEFVKSFESNFAGLILGERILLRRAT